MEILLISLLKTFAPIADKAKCDHSRLHRDWYLFQSLMSSEAEIAQLQSWAFAAAVPGEEHGSGPAVCCTLRDEEFGGPQPVTHEGMAWFRIECPQITIT